MSTEDASYQSRPLAELTVILPDGEEHSIKDVRVELLSGGALRVYRERTFSDAVPFETVYPHGAWTRYNAIPKRSR